MQILPFLVIDCEELPGIGFQNRLNNLFSIIDEHGAAAVRLTGAVGRDAVLKDEAATQLMQRNIVLI